MAPDGHEFRVLDTHLVTPSSPDVPCSLPLTFFDVKWLHLPPVERVFFYRLPQDADADAILSSLKASLSHTLRAFYPLAGHVRLVPGTSNRHELLYQPGDGVVFTTAEYDAGVDDLAASPDGGGDPVPVSRLSPLVPRLPEGRAVLAVQGTLLRCRRGLAVGVTVHHSACDGNSSMHFLRTWAAACAGEASPPTPVIDRTLVPDPMGLYDTYLERMPPSVRRHDFEFVGKAGAGTTADEEKRLMATFTLSEEVLQTIRAGYASARAPTAPSRCSSLVAACGFMWWCHSRATPPQLSDNDNNNKTKKRRYFLLSVDHRARLDPPVPAGYFGNCLCPAIATAAQDELAGAGAGAGGGLYAACAAVAAAVEEEVGEGARERWGVCMERVREAVVNGTLSVAGSPRFRVYDVDFGFGRPAKVDIVSVAKTGAISVAEARGSAGRGMEVGVSLPPPAMERFRACFKDGVAWLRGQ